MIQTMSLISMTPLEAILEDATQNERTNLAHLYRNRIDRAGINDLLEEHYIRHELIASVRQPVGV